MTSKPGEMALVAMKKLDKAVVPFKVPDAPAPRKFQMKILTEEQYIEEMGKIIQKDFFPDLEKLKTQVAYLDALEKNDVAKLREIYAKYSGRKPTRHGSESPATFETPVRNIPSPRSTFSTPSAASMSHHETIGDTASVCSSRKSQKNPSDGHSLDSFLSNYTSEDNCSFQELIEKSDKKLRQKFAVLFDAEEDTALTMARNLCIPSAEEQCQPICGPKAVQMWTYTNKNSAMYTPDGVDLTKEEKIEMVNKKQEINYGNTRFNHTPFDDRRSQEAINEAAKSQTKNVVNRVGIDGNTLAETARAGNRNAFSFVKTPSPHPGVAESPLMTWGEMEGTPFRLDGSDTPLRPVGGPSFFMAETSKRETLGHALAIKAGERMREQKAKELEARKNIASPYIRSTMDRLASMSPAAKRLASSSRIGVRDSLLTPSPRMTPSNKLATPSPLVRRKTPLIRTPKTAAAKTALTDDLLKIPTLPKRS